MQASNSANYFVSHHFVICAESLKTIKQLIGSASTFEDIMLLFIDCLKKDASGAKEWKSTLTYAFGVEGINGDIAFLFNFNRTI